jgi:dethiobiotin synthetase
LFFTGTDTGVGKTIVAAAVARWLRRQGRPVRVSKPVATGARWTGDRWLSDDTVLLARALGLTDGLEQVTPWTFAAAAAPPVAARQAGVRLTLGAIVAAIQKSWNPGTVMLVEGIGGLLCPLTEGETVADLVGALGLPLVIVARRSLGTLNHTLLTVEAARGRRFRVAGVVVNETSPCQGVAEETNVDELRRRIGVPLLTVVPHHADPTSLAELEITGVDWWSLCQR